MENAASRRGCKWPMWPHASRPSHEYCGDHREEGSSYCDKHRTMSIRDLEKEPRRQFVPHRRAA